MFRRALAVLKTVSTAIGNVVGRIILTLFYFILMPPFAIWSQLKTDPLRLQQTGSGPWVGRPAAEEGLDAALRQH